MDGRTPLATVKRTGSKKTLTTANLAALGAERLADLLIDVAEGHAQIKRRLRLELAGEIGPEDLAAELAKRIDTVADSRARVHWRKHKEFVRELDMQRALIAGRLTELDATLALPTMLRFLGLAEGVFHRTADAKGEVEAVFDAAVDDVAAIAPLALPDPRALGDQLLDLLLHGPHSSSAIDIELKKIEAHFAQEESIMIRLVASLGLTFCLLAIIAFCI